MPNYFKHIDKDLWRSWGREQGVNAVITFPFILAASGALHIPLAANDVVNAPPLIAYGLAQWDTGNYLGSVAPIADATFAAGMAGELSAGAGALHETAIVENLAMNRAILGGDAEISVAFRPGGFGHNKVGIRLAGDQESQWFHMTRDPVPGGKPVVIVSPEGEFAATTPPKSEYVVSSVPISAARAKAALNQAQTLESRGDIWYALCIRDCATTTRSILGSAGLEAPAGTLTPNATFRWFENVGGK